MNSEPSPTLPGFIEWAKCCGHYQIDAMYKHYLAFLKNGKPHDAALKKGEPR